MIALLLVASVRAAFGRRAENVVFMLADDLGYADVSVPPHDEGPWVTHTPHLEWMAREGLTLTGYRNAAAACSPSRLAIVTGVFPSRFGVLRDLGDGFRGLPRAATIAASFRDAGLVTGHIGKWDLGGVSRRAWLTRNAASCMYAPAGPLEHGFDEYVGRFASARDDKASGFCCGCCARSPYDEPRGCRMACGSLYSRSSSLWHTFAPGNATAAPTSGDVTARTAAEAVAFVRRHAPSRRARLAHPTLRPRRFFLDVWFDAPGAPPEAVAPFFDAKRPPTNEHGDVYARATDQARYNPERLGRAGTAADARAQQQIYEDVSLKLAASTRVEKATGTIAWSGPLTLPSARCSRSSAASLAPRWRCLHRTTVLRRVSAAPRRSAGARGRPTRAAPRLRACFGCPARSRQAGRVTSSSME